MGKKKRNTTNKNSKKRIKKSNKRYIKKDYFRVFGELGYVEEDYEENYEIALEFNITPTQFYENVSLMMKTNKMIEDGYVNDMGEVNRDRVLKDNKLIELYHAVDNTGITDKIIGILENEYRCAGMYEVGKTAKDHYTVRIYELMYELFGKGLEKELMKSEIVVNLRKQHNKEKSKRIKETRGTFVECLICSKGMVGVPESEKVCNSHTIPDFVLESIEGDSGTENGVLSSSIIATTLDFTPHVGLSNANTFRNICRKCDSIRFQGYESKDMLGSIGKGVKNEDEMKKIFDTIALKTLLNRVYFYDKTVMGVLEHRDYNLRDTKAQIDLITKSEKTTNKKQVFKTILPYNVGFAVQGMVNPDFIFSGVVDESIYEDNFTSNYMYINVFPIGEETVVIVFCDNTEKYDNFIHDVENKYTEEDILKKISYLIRRDMDNMLFSPKIFGDFEWTAKDKLLLVYSPAKIDGEYTENLVLGRLGINEDTVTNLFDVAKKDK